MTTRKELIESEYGTTVQLSTGQLDLKPTVQLSTETNEIDDLYLQLKDLVNDKFRGWYCKQFFYIGKERVLILAAQARADYRTSPQRLFSYLLKKG